jgi:hypothetical protein
VKTYGNITPVRLHSVIFSAKLCRCSFSRSVRGLLDLLSRIFILWMTDKGTSRTNKITEIIYMWRTGGRQLWMRLCTVGFHKMRRISLLSEKWLAFQGALCCIARVIRCKGRPINVSNPKDVGNALIETSTSDYYPTRGQNLVRFIWTFSKLSLYMQCV